MKLSQNNTHTVYMGASPHEQPQDTRPSGLGVLRLDLKDFVLPGKVPVERQILRIMNELSEQRESGKSLNLARIIELGELASRLDSSRDNTNLIEANPQTGYPKADVLTKAVAVAEFFKKPGERTLADLQSLRLTLRELQSSFATDATIELPDPMYFAERYASYIEKNQRTNFFNSEQFGALPCSDNKQLEIYRMVLELAHSGVFIPASSQLDQQGSIKRHLLSALRKLKHGRNIEELQQELCADILGDHEQMTSMVASTHGNEQVKEALSYIASIAHHFEHAPLLLTALHKCLSLFPAITRDFTDRILSVASSIERAEHYTGARGAIEATLKGLYSECVVAANLARVGYEVVGFGVRTYEGQEFILNDEKDHRKKYLKEIDIVVKDKEGKLFFIEVKSSFSSFSRHTNNSLDTQAQDFLRTAASHGAKPAVVVFSNDIPTRNEIERFLSMYQRNGLTATLLTLNNDEQFLKIS